MKSVALGLLGIGVTVLAFCAVADGQARGDAGHEERGRSRGREIFAAKACARCHLAGPQKGAGPPLADVRRPQGAYELAGRFWNHTPAMFTVLSQEGVEWPRFTVGQMADLMAYLQADPARDGAPDLGRGQMTLVRKACLKCHRFNGEGGQIGPDLTSRREELAPPARWAATIWGHTPRMAVAALERGVMYPRFTSDEMNNLVGFLRQGGGP